MEMFFSKIKYAWPHNCIESSHCGLLYPHITISTISYYFSRTYCLCVGFWTAAYTTQVSRLLCLVAEYDKLLLATGVLITLRVYVQL
jgi:hypothetical protein